ncbi:hypothetical protein H696_03514 [Fonticula alba]|uniref:very-long-chain (3R)-3-hydroxyacyl-CoA dehydratase n=1 Tax=Fonticula alba TaxID=691883 RepID=A0A058Z7H8_FONAL|nr:hypothetical protein H696_03514 [Fonticula alba]KCV70051.1 hypothetical protein H696_03514 [Fonticula alba]|eukprot:XP_009495657.1 hypothetical protein H696_03514 [Fonticula alba]
MTTLIQVCSRLFIVWSIGYSIEQSQSHWSFTTMVVSWCITEVIRYVYYAFNLIGGVPSLITWLRYTTFFILYPTGAGSEFVFAYCALPFIQNIYLYYFVCFTLVLYFPLFPVQYFHMISQRRKYLGRGRSSGKAKTQ